MSGTRKFEEKEPQIQSGGDLEKQAEISKLLPESLAMDLSNLPSKTQPKRLKEEEVRRSPKITHFKPPAPKLTEAETREKVSIALAPFTPKPSGKK